MAQKYKSRGKKVQKMSRDGLIEETLEKGAVEEIATPESIKKKRLRQYSAKIRNELSKPEKPPGWSSKAKRLARYEAFSGMKKATHYGTKGIQNESDDNSAVRGVYAGETVAEDAVRSLREAQQKNNRTSRRFISRERAKKRWRTEGTLAKRLRFEDSKEHLFEKRTSSAEWLGAKKRAVGLENGEHTVAADERKRLKRLNKILQKRKYKKIYARTKGQMSAGGGMITSGGTVVESVTEKGKRVAKELLFKSRSVLLAMGVFALLFVLIIASLGSCSAGIQGAGSLIRITSYTSTDDDIYRAEEAYVALEQTLNEQINQMRQEHPGYEDYRYQVDEISHNPYHLISYLTAKHGTWTYEDVRDELQTLFEQQYNISTRTSNVATTDTRTVRVGDSLGNVVTSAYCSCAICCGPWAGGSTASGTVPRANHTLAVDATNPFVPIGTRIVMNGVEYTVEDTGAFGRFGVQFDVYFDSHQAALEYGHKTWEAFLADDNGSREVTVTSTDQVETFSTTLANRGFDAVARANLNVKELLIYDALNQTLGNRDYLFDRQTISAGSGGMSYDIPPSALSDQRFANMIHEAEKYLGYPYVWGGASPETSFDCSGFVSWVIDNCGNGWSMGRQTAEGLRNSCTFVSPAEARPGDLIFFENTYETAGASHVGIYVGEGMMIHCGDPIQYANINSSYWQEHFMCFGRLP